MALESKLTEQQLFDQLVSSLVHSAWVYLGTMKNPMNDKLEKDLEQASIQIDMLDMIYKRMTGNLSQDEEKFFSENLTYDSEYKLITIIFLVIITFIIYILISLLTKAFKTSDIKLKY